MVLRIKQRSIESLSLVLFYRLQVLDFSDSAKRNNYVDPRIFLIREWRDEFAYGDKGQQSGWTRRIESKGIQEYTR